MTASTDSAELAGLLQKTPLTRRAILVSTLSVGFAAAVEPENTNVRAAQTEVHSLRERDEATLPSTLGRERLINPFLRCTEASVRESAERHAGRSLPTVVDVFAEVRAWKDGFR